MQSIEEILKDRIERFNANPIEALKFLKTSYRNEWNKGIEHFQKRINKEREIPLKFIAIRQKLIALKEIDDLRWFYGICDKYSKTKDKQGNQNTFSKCFFGALKNL